MRFIQNSLTIPSVQFVRSFFGSSQRLLTGSQSLHNSQEACHSNYEMQWFWSWTLVILELLMSEVYWQRSTLSRRGAGIRADPWRPTRWLWAGCATLVENSIFRASMDSCMHAFAILMRPLFSSYRMKPNVRRCASIPMLRWSRLNLSMMAFCLRGSALVQWQGLTRTNFQWVPETYLLASSLSRICGRCEETPHAE
jgi:hypothetical protein